MNMTAQHAIHSPEVETSSYVFMFWCCSSWKSATFGQGYLLIFITSKGPWSKVGSRYLFDPVCRALQTIPVTRADTQHVTPPHTHTQTQDHTICSTFKSFTRNVKCHQDPPRGLSDNGVTANQTVKSGATLTSSAASSQLASGCFEDSN